MIDRYSDGFTDRPGSVGQLIGVVLGTLAGIVVLLAALREVDPHWTVAVALIVAALFAGTYGIVRVTWSTNPVSGLLSAGSLVVASPCFAIGSRWFLEAVVAESPPDDGSAIASISWLVGLAALGLGLAVVIVGLVAASLLLVRTDRS